MARPSKLTPEVAQRIVAAIRAGNYAEPSARSAGISPATFYRWMERGEKQRRGIYHDFYEEVRRAEADAEVEAVARVRKGMADDWRACMNFLERRYPKRWRRRESHEHSGGLDLQVGAEMLDDPETRRALREALRAAGRARAGESTRPRPGN